MEKVQYGGPKFMTIFSEPRCYTYDAKCLKLMHDVTNKQRQFSFFTARTMIYYIFILFRDAKYDNNNNND